MRDTKDTENRRPLPDAEADGIIEGRNAVIEALRVDTPMDKIYIAKGETDIIAGRHIDFYLEITGIDHRYNRHSGSHRFVGIEIFLLDIPIERSDKPGIFQSIFMRIIFRGDLLQTIHRFIVIIFRYTFTVIQFYHPFSLGFNLFVFGFGSFILQFIIPRVDLCNHFSFTHKTTHLHRNPDDRSGYPKCQIYVGRSLNTPRIGHL